MNRPEAAVPLEIPHTDTEPGIVGDFMALTKARLSLLVVVTTLVGACAA